MAHDRLYLACRHCDSVRVLWKHYPGGGYCPQDIEDLDRFIKTHLMEHGDGYHDRLGLPPPFEPLTEESPRAREANAARDARLRGDADYDP